MPDELAAEDDVFADDDKLDEGNELEANEALELESVALPGVEALVDGLVLLPPPPQPDSIKIKNEKMESDNIVVIFLALIVFRVSFVFQGFIAFITFLI